MLSETGDPLPDLPMVDGVHQSPMFSVGVLTVTIYGVYTYVNM